MMRSLLFAAIVILQASAAWSQGLSWPVPVIEDASRSAGSGSVPATYWKFKTSHNSGAPWCIGVNSTYGGSVPSETDATLSIGFNEDPLGNKLVNTTGATGGRLQHMMFEHGYVAATGDLTSILDELHYDVEDTAGTTYRVWHQNWAPTTPTPSFTTYWKGAFYIYAISSGNAFTGSNLQLTYTGIQIPKNGGITQLKQDNSTILGLVSLDASDNVALGGTTVWSNKAKLTATNGWLKIGDTTAATAPVHVAATLASSNATGYYGEITMTPTAATMYGGRVATTYGSGGSSSGTGIGFQSDISCTGTTKPSALIAFNAQTNNQASGTISAMTGFKSGPAVQNSGADVTNMRHFWAGSVFTSGGGHVGTQYGYYVDDLSNADTNYAFYAAGDDPSFFGGDVRVSKTVTAGGTTGAQTINKTAGSVNFAAAATSVAVTNSLVTSNSVIVATVSTNDTTLKSVQAVPGSGTFTLYANAAATAETRVSFLVIN